MRFLLSHPRETERKKKIMPKDRKSQLLCPRKKTWTKVLHKYDLAQFFMACLFEKVTEVGLVPLYAI